MYCLSIISELADNTARYEILSDYVSNDGAIAWPNRRIAALSFPGCRLRLDVARLDFSWIVSGIIKLRNAG
jgi:hypothetical protein